MDMRTPKIMAVLNVTPDSFSDGGLYNDPETTYNRIQELVRDGADIIDIGGESTRPGSSYVSCEEELARLKPVIDSIVTLPLPANILFSIDTFKATVADYALTHGFAIVNDVTAFRCDPRMLDVLMLHKPDVVLMYSKDSTPRTTRAAREYDDVILTIKNFLTERIRLLENAGFPREKIIVDPGTGLFISLNPQYTLEIIDRLGELSTLGCPILIGVSRKMFIGKTRNRDEKDALSVALSLKAIQNGASIVRVHNVAFMKKALNQPL